MSIFSNLSHEDRAAIFSGDEFTAEKLPCGILMTDDTVFVLTAREGLNTFRLVNCPKRKSKFGAKATWMCDQTMKGKSRINEKCTGYKVLRCGLTEAW